MNRYFVIDGYNLLHALGLIPRQLGPHSLEKARGRMLALLAVSHGDYAGNVTVVFDAPNPSRNLEPVQYIRSLEVLYAVKHQEADDLIAELVQHHSSPRQLVVVSDDREVQRAGARRHCQIMDCDTYINWLQREHNRHRQQTSAPPEPEKTETLTEAERNHWIQEFADLETDPAMKELFNPFDFED